MESQIDRKTKMPESIDPNAVPIALQELRKHIDGIDNKILDLLAQRKSIVAEVAGVKKELSLKVRDRVREAEILEARRNRCQQLGLRNEVIESLYRVVLTASRDQQASMGTEVPQNLPQKRIAVIGGHGAMGSMFAQLFTELGQDVVIADLDTTLSPQDAARDADMVMVSVPMNVTEKVIREVAPLVQETGLICDLTSTKTIPVTAMCESGTCDVIGLHPMFGPNVHTLQEQRVVFVPARIAPASEWDSWLRTCLLARGFTLVDSTAEEHDRTMSIVQVLTHFSTEVLGLSMARTGVSVEETLRFASPVYLIDMVMTARHFCQSPELYGSIHLANPNAKEVVTAFQESLNAKSQWAWRFCPVLVGHNAARAVAKDVVTLDGELHNVASLAHTPHLSL